MEPIGILILCLICFFLGGSLGVKAEQRSCKHKWTQLGETVIVRSPQGLITKQIKRYTCTICGEIKTFNDEV